MPQTVAVLGATINQLPFILAAKRRGIRTISLDNDLSNICHQHSDIQANLSTADRDGILQYLRTQKIDGVVTCASDVALPTAAYVCEQLHLPTVSSKAVATTIHKQAFRSFQDTHRLPSPRSLSFQSTKDALHSMQKLQGSWVVKPADSSGSKGISLVNLRHAKNKKGFDRVITQAIEQALAISQSGIGIIEEFLDGTHCSVDGFIHDGVLTQLYITNKSITRPPHLTPISHTLPSLLSEAVQQSIHAEVLRVLRLLEVRTGPFDFDLLITPEKKVVVIEMSLRIGGNGIPTLVKYATGNSLYETVLSFALSQPLPQVADAPARLHTGLYLLRSQASGVVEGMPDLSEVRSRFAPELLELVYDVQIGDRVSAFTQGNHRIGHVVLQAKSPHELDQLAVAVQKALRITVHE